MIALNMLCATAGLIIVLIGVMSLILRAANWASKEQARKNLLRQTRKKRM